MESESFEPEPWRDHPRARALGPGAADNVSIRVINSDTLIQRKARRELQDVEIDRRALSKPERTSPAGPQLY